MRYIINYFINGEEHQYRLEANNASEAVDKFKKEAVPALGMVRIEEVYPAKMEQL